MTRDGERNWEVGLQGSSLDYDRETPLPSGIECKKSKGVLTVRCEAC